MVLAWLLLAAAHAAGARPVGPAYEGNCQAPVWSRDGSKLLYEVNYHDRKRVEMYLFEPGKGDPVEIRPPLGRPGSALVAGFRTASGEHVVHEASWGPAVIGRFVYSASTAAKDYDLVLSGAGPLAPAPGADGGPDWSPDGRWIVFTSARTGEGDLYLLDAHALDRPPRRLTRMDGSSELYAAFSPDSRRVAFVAHGPHGDNLYVLDDLEHPEPRRLTDWPGVQTRPSWSPDGRRIAFYANRDRSDRFDLYVLNVDGGQPYPIARGVVPSRGGPSWTPDGRAIVAVLDDDPRFDPVVLIPIDDPDRLRVVPTRTVGNGDLDVVRGTDGRTWLAVAAQGRVDDEVRDFKRIFVMPLPAE